ncbi:type III glutamate--ammonia ligase [Pleurocapsa sp. CCALA 161]|uniref:type III glutamate--ammonia ligase n=1 Tax=Pleurocapsa sp. CCALA 161 TaxID=2107688 RepID=UPI000D06E112|nr:type III glutamate--ammonia ligase [Pleurocapsa sp. CCALA 161]PSB06761.1 type III glutamate--ammonia ligase [Pleurocapsa sp. CCALA 161]
MLLSELARDRNIRYFLISFTDLLGVQRAKLVPAQSIDEMAENGAGFAGFAAWLDMSPADPDIFAIPDRNSLFQLPWQPHVAWMPADLYGVDGNPLMQSPRVVLKQILKAAKEQGYTIKTGVECEYFLLSPDELEIADSRDRSPKPCYDQQALMRRYDVVSEICDAMLSLGWKPYQTDHEDGNGQFEMNWTYDDAIVTADRHAFFKYMTKSIAEKHGFRATFMPKPFANLTGNGCHTHLSVWDITGETNLFKDEKSELSTIGYQFIGGVLKSASALCAFTNPAINSYKRINALNTVSGATWSPNTISYSGNNRTHMIRIPDLGRFEFRLADGAANPYLLPASIIAAGLDGIERKINPGDRSKNNNYTEPLSDQTKRLPGNLLDALRCLEKNTVLAKAMGESFINSYLKLKYQQWDQYNNQISDWELDSTLDC